MVWYVSVYKVRQSRIGRTSIICNDLICQPLESVLKYKPCGQTDRQTDRQTSLQLPIETQFYNLRTTPLPRGTCPSLLYSNWYCTAKERFGGLIPHVCVLVTICCSWSGLYEELEHRTSFSLCSTPPRAESLRKTALSLVCLFFLSLFLLCVLTSISISKFRRRTVFVLSCNDVWLKMFAR